jgi:hypothetical protein
MKQIVEAMRGYRETYGTLPTDIYDKQGKPLLSWRVAILPFIEEDHLYQQFHLDEPWDSPHNKKLLGRMPKRYFDPWGVGDTTPTTCCLRPRGGGAVFLRDPPGVVTPILGDPSQKVLLVEADEAQAVSWTRPDDLDYDPANPTAGLGRRFSVGFIKGRGDFVALADGSVRFVPADADPEALRSLFSAAWNEPPQLTRPWYAALTLRPLCFLAVPSFLFALCAIGGGVAVAYRLVKGRTTSPGEFLWLIVGVNQLVYLSLFIAWYRVELFPVPGREPEEVRFWAVPGAAGTLASLLPLVWGQCRRDWLVLFIANLALWVLMTWDALVPDGYNSVEESLLTAAPPFVLGGISLAAMAMTRSGVPYPGRTDRRFAHWAGMAVCLLPLLGVVVSSSFGLVPSLGPWFQRIRE